ncbi:MAG TPA: ATP-binding protein [Chloroflexia bacterium]|nr:ATP-binding protein [Chloroflexia bacterium]
MLKSPGPSRSQSATPAPESALDGAPSVPEAAESANDSRWRAVWDLAADAMALSDPSGVVLAANPAYYELYGLRPEAVVGRDFAQIFAPERQEAARKDYANTFQKPDIDPVVTRVVRRSDGTQRTVEVRYTFLTENGRRSAMLSLIRDITDRREVHAALAARTRLLAFSAAVGMALTQHEALPEVLSSCAEAMVEHLDGSLARIWVCNPRTNVLELEASAGLSQRLDGTHSRVPVGEFKIGRIAATRRPHLTNEVLTDAEIQHPEWARREGLVAFAGYPLLVEDRLVGVMALFARQPLPDSTLDTLATVAHSLALGIDRHRSAAERARLTAELQQALHLRDEFLLIAAHELRTPITSIKALAQLLLRRTRGEVHPRVEQGLQSIAAQVDRLTALINELLDVSRLENGRISLECAPLDLGALATEVAAEVQMLSDLHPIAVDVQGGPVVVPADSERLRQVLVNLVQNGIKYAPSGGPVDVRVWQTEVRAFVSVRDRGIGIPADQLGHVFERYYRAANATGAQFRGLGLGLHISRELVSRHGGELTVESVEGQGSTFTFWLPRSVPVPEAAP